MKLLHLGALAVTISFFVACSNKGDDSSEEKPSSLATDVAWYNPSQTEFVITTAEALAGLAKLVNDGNDFAGKTIKLGADIMLNDTTNWKDWENNPPAKKWIPIGAFKGIFDGNNHIISGVYVYSDNGLFNYSEGTIKNVGVAASYIIGYVYTGGLVGDNRGMISNSYFIGIVNAQQHGECIGGLVGQNWDGKIINSYSAGTVIGGSVIGGLVGCNYGEITGSYSTSAVTGNSSIGGLIGYNSTSSGSDGCHTISDSYSTGAVNGESKVGGFVGDNNYCAIVSSYSASAVNGKNKVGGFVGDNESGSISYSYSTGTVNGENDVGGFAGYNGWATIRSSYSAGTVIGKSNVGGLVGSSEQSGFVKNSYSTSAVTGENDVGGLVGNNKSGAIDSSYSIGAVTGKNNAGGLVGNNKTVYSDNNVSYGKINSSYYDKETSGKEFGVGLGDINSLNDYGKTTAEMKQQATFSVWDFDNIWGINSANNNGYPYLLKPAKQ